MKKVMQVLTGEISRLNGLIGELGAEVQEMQEKLDTRKSHLAKLQAEKEELVNFANQQPKAD